MKNLQGEPFHWFFHGKKIAHSKAILSKRPWRFAKLLIPSIFYSRKPVGLDLFIKAITVYIYNIGNCCVLPSLSMDRFVFTSATKNCNILFYFYRVDILRSQMHVRYPINGIQAQQCLKTNDIN